METFFAEPERYSKVDVDNQIQFVANHELIQSITKIVQGFFAVLNDKRQIIAINQSFLESLGLKDSYESFGLRLGETVKCINANIMEGGCGTSEYCKTCGAAISMVTALKENKISERICSIRTKPNGKQKNIYFKVKSSPIDIDNHTLILIFLEDITYQQKMAELEKLFFHDIYNKISGIINGCEILKYQSTENSEIIQIIYDLTYQMVREIEFQKNLVKSDIYSLDAENDIIELNKIYHELNQVFSNHSVVAGKILEFPYKIENLKFYSDISIIVRVMTNMIKNALEASENGSRVTVKHEIQNKMLIFKVWNETYIKEEIAHQIFKRNITTKKGLGHGFGTFSMKILGEEILGGEIDFQTSPEEGTTFSFKIKID